MTDFLFSTSAAQQESLETTKLRNILAETQKLVREKQESIDHTRSLMNDNRLKADAAVNAAKDEMKDMQSRIERVGEELKLAQRNLVMLLFSRTVKAATKTTTTTTTTTITTTITYFHIYCFHR